ncbi:MAG: DUF72 domain-containing protein [Sulfolobales archaeon]
MVKRILVGTCGFPRRREDIYKNLDAVEIQETFYDLISIERAKKISSEKPENFTITAKVFQALTHNSSSPTWKRMKTKLEGDPKSYGSLRPTRENMRLWERVLELFRLMNVEIAVFQTPSSFGFSEENYANVKDFFSSISRKGLKIAWEPRGSWGDPVNKERLCRLLAELNVIHVVDIFRNTPCTENQSVLYIRLHGIGGREVNYRYKYTDEDLLKLKEILSQHTHDTAYVMFNNVYMYGDALRFKHLL